MGFTGFVYDTTLEAVTASRKFVRENGDILAHHLEGVPWAEALNGRPFPRPARRMEGQEVGHAATSTDVKKLYRSTTDKWVAGVFGGLGEIFDIDPNIVRLAALFLGISTGVAPLLMTYLVAWFVVRKVPPVYE